MINLSSEYLYNIYKLKCGKSDENRINNNIFFKYKIFLNKKLKYKCFLIDDHYTLYVMI